MIRSGVPNLERVRPADRGSQYASGDFQRLLKAFHMRGSMSRKGDCWDIRRNCRVVPACQAVMVIHMPIGQEQYHPVSK